MTRRRDFLKTSSLVSAGLFFTKPFESLAAISAQNKGLHTEINTLRIFHTNNLHGHLNSCSNGFGGLYNVAQTLQQQDKGILLDAGDFLDDKLSLQQQHQAITQMNKTGYHAVTIGNHDIANGQQQLADLASAMNFPLINCNYQFSNTALRNKIRTHTILKYGKFKIGITGVGNNLDTKLKNREKISCSHPYTSANAFAAYLKEVEQCDLVICLSHLNHNKKSGGLNNADLAANSKNIDVIIGGHGRTLTISPFVIKNKVKEEVLVSQTGWDGLMLRKLEFTFNAYGKNGLVTKNFIPGLSSESDVYTEYKKMTA